MLSGLVWCILFVVVGLPAVSNADADTKYITTWTQPDLDGDNLGDDRLGDNSSAPIAPAPSTSTTTAPAPTGSTPTALTITS